VTDSPTLDASGLDMTRTLRNGLVVVQTDFSSGPAVDVMSRNI